MRTHRIAAIPADGIGPEVINAGLEVLAALAETDGNFRLEVEHFDWGTDRYKKTGSLMPEDGAEQLRRFDAIFFGAVGAPDVADHITLWGLRLFAPREYCPASPARCAPPARTISTG
jgi:tartrate dehydrogenase/decarboxylase/D-malate dehydrogenase